MNLDWGAQLSGAYVTVINDVLSIDCANDERKVVATLTVGQARRVLFHYSYVTDLAEVWLLDPEDTSGVLLAPTDTFLCTRASHAEPTHFNSTVFGTPGSGAATIDDIRLATSLEALGYTR